jgi:hypothetical protein
MTVQGLTKWRCLHQLSILRASFLPAFWLATSSERLFPPDVRRELAGAPGAMISKDSNDPNDEPLRDFPVALTERLRNTPSPGLRSGNPTDTDPWGWSCGFYPGCHPREQQRGTAATFDQARADFLAAWRVFLSNRSEVDFQAWRRQRDWTAEKYPRFDRGESMPHDWRPGA